MEGPAGTGKSRALLQYAHWACRTYPGIRVLFVRQVKADFGQSILVTFEDKVLYPGHPVLRSSGDVSRKNRDNYLYPYDKAVVDGKTYEGQSEIVISGLDRPERTFSMEYCKVCVFEGHEISEESWEKLIRVNRNHVLPWQSMIMDTNPAAKTHWANVRASEPYVIPRELKDVLPPARPGQTRMTRLKSVHKDNPFLWDNEKEQWTREGADYMGKLHNMSGHIKDRMLRGLWVTAEGQIWETFNPDWHMVDLVGEGDEFHRDENGKLKFNWYFASVDWGFRHAGVFGVFGVDEEDRLFRVAEWYRCEMGSEWWADVCVRATDEFPIQTIVADPSRPDMIALFNQKISSNCGRDVGNMCTRADNDLMSGLDLVREGFKANKLFLVRNATRGGKCPIRKEKKSPTALEEEIESYVWKKPLTERSAAKEEPVNETQHMSFDACDTLRYACKRAFLTDLTPSPHVETFGVNTWGSILRHDDVDFGPVVSM